MGQTIEKRVPLRRNCAVRRDPRRTGSSRRLCERTTSDTVRRRSWPGTASGLAATPAPQSCFRASFAGRRRSACAAHDRRRNGAHLADSRRRIDEATIRRHLDTVNAGRDNEASILLGDYLFARAFRLAASLDNPFAVRCLIEANRLMCERAPPIQTRKLRSDRGRISRNHRRQDRRGFCTAAVIGAHYPAPRRKRQALTLGRKLGSPSDCR